MERARLLRHFPHPCDGSEHDIEETPGLSSPKTRLSLRRWWTLTTHHDFFASPASRRGAWVLLWPPIGLVIVVHALYDALTPADSVAVSHGGGGWKLWAELALCCFLLLASRLSVKSALPDALLALVLNGYVVGHRLVFASSQADSLEMSLLCFMASTGIHSLAVAGSSLVCAASGWWLVSAGYGLTVLGAGLVSSGLCALSEYHVAALVVELQSHKASIAYLLEHVSEGYCVVDLTSGLVLESSPSFMSFVGYEAHGWNFTDLAEASDHAGLRAMFNNALAGEELRPLYLSCIANRESDKNTVVDVKVVPFAVSGHKVSLCLQRSGEKRRRNLLCAATVMGLNAQSWHMADIQNLSTASVDPRWSGPAEASRSSGAGGSGLSDTARNLGRTAAYHKVPSSELSAFSLTQSSEISFQLSAPSATYSTSLLFASSSIEAGVQTSGLPPVEDKATETYVISANDGGFRCTRCSKPPLMNMNNIRGEFEGSESADRQREALSSMSGASSSSGLASPQRRRERSNVHRIRTARSIIATLPSESSFEKSKSRDAEALWRGAQENSRPFMNGFQLTPMETIQASLLEAMEMWNPPRLPNLCCPWHMSIWTASTIVHTFWTWECRPLWGPRSAWQCSECLGMNDAAAEEECDICAGPRMGSEKRSESSRLATDASVAASAESVASAESGLSLATL